MFQSIFIFITLGAKFLRKSRHVSSIFSWLILKYKTHFQVCLTIKNENTLQWQKLVFLIDLLRLSSTSYIFSFPILFAKIVWTKFIWLSKFIRISLHDKNDGNSHIQEVEKDYPIWKYNYFRNECLIFFLFPSCRL